MKLKCIGKDNTEREFDVFVKETSNGYPWFLVSNQSINDELVCNEFFDLILKPLDDASHMVLMINANGAYGGYGIPEAILQFSAKYLSTGISSSPSISEDSWRTTEATKVWERLVAAKKAEYNKDTDIYRLI